MCISNRWTHRSRPQKTANDDLSMNRIRVMFELVHGRHHYPNWFLNEGIPARASQHFHIEKIITDAHCRAGFSGAGQLWGTVLMLQRIQISPSSSGTKYHPALGGIWSSRARPQQFLRITYCMALALKQHTVAPPSQLRYICRRDYISCLAIFAVLTSHMA